MKDVLRGLVCELSDDGELGVMLCELDFNLIQRQHTLFAHVSCVNIIRLPSILLMLQFSTHFSLRCLE